MSSAASVAAVLVAVVFAWAAVAKASRRHSTAVAFAELGLPMAGLLAVVVPVGEMAIAAGLLVAPAVGGALALAALAAFTLVVVRAITRGAPGGCGCFGSRRVEPVSPADVVRNGILAVFAAIATGTTRLEVPAPLPAAVMVSAILAAGVANAAARRRLA